MGPGLQVTILLCMTIITYIIESTLTAPRAADVTTGAAAGLAALPDGSDVLGLVPVHQEHTV